VLLYHFLNETICTEIKIINETHFPKIRLAESSLIYEIVKGETIPAIMRIPNSKLFHFRGHFHRGYNNSGDRMKSCMSADRYQLCPRHCNISHVRTFYVSGLKGFAKLNHVKWYRFTGVQEDCNTVILRVKRPRNLIHIPFLATLLRLPPLQRIHLILIKYCTYNYH